MGRAATTSDVFNAIAEPRRRELIALLSGAPSRSVGELVDAMNLAQPSVSKHLGVLRAAAIVSVERMGKHRLYRLNPDALKPVHDWAIQFEQLWSRQLARVKARAERRAVEQARTN